MDGTIVSSYERITTRTVEAFTAAREAGIEIFFVTGRPPRWMPEIKEAFGFGNAICANGAMHYDLINEIVLEEWLIPLDIQFEFVKRMRAAVPSLSFATEYGDEFHHESAYIPRWDVGVDISPVHRIEEKLLKPAFKMLARCSDFEFTSDELLVIAQREVGDLVTITHSNANESLLEISALGISKGTTLAKVAGRLGIDAADCVSFGDNPNDFPMLQWSGRSFAMADGHPDGIKFAKDLAPSHDVDGVAMIIEKLLELPA